MAQLRESGVFNFSTSSGIPSVVSTAGAMPEDPRSPGVVGNATDAGFLNFLPMTVLCAAAPSALSTTNIATNQSGASGVALSLTAGTGVTSGLVGTTGVLFLDSAPATNPTTDFTKTLARAVRVFSSGNDTNKTFTVAGFDLYGNFQSQVITGSSGTATTTTKCWKSILSVTPSTATASGVSVGTADTYAFPMRVDNFDETIIFWNNALITAPTGFTGADVTSPQTTTSGEPKGRYAVQSASDGTKRLVMYQVPKSLTAVTGMFGMTPA